LRCVRKESSGLFLNLATTLTKGHKLMASDRLR
jgi:hypothetical protein